MPGARRRTIDIAFTRARLAVFVDGCFWHYCPEHGTSPASNASWWAAKLARNVERDFETRLILERAGWEVMRVWEHERPDDVVDLVIQELERIRDDRRRP